MNKPRGLLSLLFHSWSYPVEPIVPSSYRNRCPDCGLDFIGPGRMAMAKMYLEHYVTDCPGVVRPIRDPGLPA